MREFATGATRDEDTEKLDYEGFLSPLVLRRYASYMHEHRLQADGKLRASDNWQKGIPREAYMKSLFRHFMDVWMIWREQYPLGRIWEDTLCAMLFNLQGLLFESIRTSQDTAGLEVYPTDPGGYGKGVVGASDLAHKLLEPDELGLYKDKINYAYSGPSMVSREVKK
jgi:hypothetical protein